MGPFRILRAPDGSDAPDPASPHNDRALSIAESAIVLAQVPVSGSTRSSSEPATAETASGSAPCALARAEPLLFEPAPVRLRTSQPALRVPPGALRVALYPLTNFWTSRAGRHAEVGAHPPRARRRTAAHHTMAPHRTSEGPADCSPTRTAAQVGPGRRVGMPHPTARLVRPSSFSRSTQRSKRR